jgi:hypothetical protein
MQSDKQQPKTDGRHSNGQTREHSGQPRHHEWLIGWQPTFFRSGGRWWRDNGNGNQTEAADLVLTRTYLILKKMWNTLEAAGVIEKTGIFG